MPGIRHREPDLQPATRDDCAMLHRSSPSSLIVPQLRAAHIALAIIAILAVTGCASAPQKAILYPQGPSLATQERANRALQACERRAENDVGRNDRNLAQGQTGRTGKAVLTEGAAEAAEAATSGLIKNSGDLLRGTLAGGVGGLVGAAVKVGADWNKADRVYERYVEQCMKDRGHVVLGWR